MLLSKYTILARIKPHGSPESTPSRLSAASLLQSKRPSPGGGNPAAQRGKAGTGQNLTTTGSKSTLVGSARPANAAAAPLRSVQRCAAIKAGKAGLAAIHLLPRSHPSHLFSEAKQHAQISPYRE